MYKITLALTALLGLGSILCTQTIPGEYVPADDEIALCIRMDTKEDIGLLVFDYSINDFQYSGGISNADKSLIKHDERLIEVWNKDTYQKALLSSADSAEISIQFRIITEYVDPNYENIYPENLTKYLEGISFEAHFGESYLVTITGDRANGYQAVLAE